jgi:hypothetical protein
VPGLGFALAACGSTFSGTTLSSQVGSWATSTGLSASVKTLQADLHLLGTLAPTAAALRSECTALVYDALNANQNLPSPDPVLTNLLSAAYSAAGSAGHDCASGANGGARSAAQRTTAHRDLIKALARFDAVTTP